MDKTPKGGNKTPKGGATPGGDKEIDDYGFRKQTTQERWF